MTSKRGPKPRWDKPGSTPPTLTNDPLLKLLFNEAAQRGQTLTALASELNTTYSMLDKWRRGDSLLGRSAWGVQTAVSEYLGVPRAFVLFAAGALTLDDFGWPGDVSLESATPAAIAVLRSSSREFDGLPDDTLELVVRTMRFASVLSGDSPPSRNARRRMEDWLQRLTSTGVRSTHLQ